MIVTGAIFKNCQPGTDPKWLMTVTVQGSFRHRAAPIIAHVGSVEVEYIMINPGGTEFFGLLGMIPQSGDVLSVGYLGEKQQPTTVAFSPSAVV
jgi:hypothetical protein